MPSDAPPREAHAPVRPLEQPCREPALDSATARLTADCVVSSSSAAELKLLILVVLAVLLCSTVATASDVAVDTPMARSPAAGESGLRASAALDSRVAGSALIIDLGPLPAEAGSARIPRKTHKRRRIGVHRPLPAEFRGNLVPLLAWEAGGDGLHTAAVTFTAKGAVSLRIAVHAELPEGGSVRVFDGDGRSRGPAYTLEDFNADSVWLPSAEGGKLTVQLAVPSPDAVADLSFTVVTVAHRFASVRPKIVPDCGGHVEIACVADRSRREMADAVGRIVFEEDADSYVCSGTLLNVGDTPDVFEPYFLTANHCVATAAVAASVEARWFWQRSNCRGGGVDDRSTVSYGGTEMLATSAGQDASLLRFRDDLPGGLVYSGWSTAAVSEGASVFSVHHPAGAVAKYAEGRVIDIATFNVSGNLVYDALETDWDRGLTEGGSSGSGLFLGASGALVGVLSGGVEGCGTRGDAYGPFRDFFPHAERWLRPRPNVPESFLHALPAVPGADAGSIAGFVRIVNSSGEAGEVEIFAIDDTGARRGPATLELGALQVAHFNSRDLESGNAAKGLRGGVGNGTGMWRLELRSVLRIEAFGYIRTPDGFVTSMQAVEAATEEGSNRYQVPFFNPGSNSNQQSLLRLINPGSVVASVEITGVDDAGDPGAGGVRLTLEAGAARTLNARDLERGGTRLTGRLGDGTGKWRLSVSGDAPLQVMSLLRLPTGHLTNLSLGRAGVDVRNPPPPPSRPDLVVQSPSVNNSRPRSGQLFTLNATVRNQGTAPSAATSLRYYRSSDTTISASDTVVGTDAVSALAVSATSPESISVRAPSSAGTYYYGACVESVSGESSTANNCSSAVQVEVLPTTAWQRSGIGADIFDLPVHIERIRIEGEFSGYSELFSVWCGGPGDRGGLLVAELLGTGWGETRYSGVHSARRRYFESGEPCRELDIDGTGVRWTVSEVSATAALSPSASSGNESADRLAVERARAQVLRHRGQSDQLD